MSREIKFRAYDTHRKRMFEVKGLKQTDIGTWEVWDGETVILPCIIQLMQYTGLKDKNGKEDYHGDVCKYKDYANNEQIGIVEWQGGAWILEAIGGDDEGNQNILLADIEWHINIGNKYENPELLKEI